MEKLFLWQSTDNNVPVFYLLIGVFSSTAQADGRYEDSLKLARKTLKEVNKFCDKVLPNRPEVVANLHSCHGNAYLELGDYKKALYHHTQDNEIGNQQ